MSTPEEGRSLSVQTLGAMLIGDVLSQTGQMLPRRPVAKGNGKSGPASMAQAQIVVQWQQPETNVLQWQATCEPDEAGWWIKICPVAFDRRKSNGRRPAQALSAGSNYIRNEMPAGRR